MPQKAFPFNKYYVYRKGGDEDIVFFSPNLEQGMNTNDAVIAVYTVEYSGVILHIMKRGL